MDKPGPVKPSKCFVTFNDCLGATHKQYCCFVCAELFPLSDKAHAVECFRRDLDARSARSLEFDDICLLLTRNFQQWKHGTFYLCPVSSCVDVDWRLDDSNAFMTGTAVVKSPPSKRAGTWLDGDRLTVFDHLAKFVDHLGSHFYEANVIGTNGSRHFKVRARLPVSLDESTIVCPIRNCKRNWKNDAAGEIAFGAHLINVHKLPILHSGDGEVVKEIGKDDEQKLRMVLPYIPDTVAPMGDMKVQPLEPRSKSFYAKLDYHPLRYKAKGRDHAYLEPTAVPPFFPLGPPVAPNPC